MASLSFDPGTPEWWLQRLVQRLMSRQDRYQLQHKYAIGDHPAPPGDEKYAKTLRQLIRRARSNYVGLAIRAVTDRMTVKDFKFGDGEKVDPDAREIWAFNNMDLQSVIAIQDGAKYGESYTLVSPPEDGKPPLITVEDPRQCITEPDPINPMKSVAGLKLYEDTILGVVVAVLFLPEKTQIYHGHQINDGNTDTRFIPCNDIMGMSPGGFKFISEEPNQLDGDIALVRGPWQPDHGRFSSAECNDDVFDIQDRINFVILSRLVIAHNQAYRQRWGTGVETPVAKKSGLVKPPFEPGADKVWITGNDKAKFGDFEEADITQLLEAARDDVGDLAAITQTPITYLTARMVNVSGEALTSAQAALVSKTKKRMKAMGWYFEEVIKLAFKYEGNSKAEEINAQTIWADPEIRSMSEMADLVSKFSSAGIPLALVMERAGFTSDEIEFAVAEAERVAAEQQAQQVEMMKQQAALAPKPVGPGGTTGAKPTGAKPKPSSAAKPTGAKTTTATAKPKPKPKA